MKNLLLVGWLALGWLALPAVAQATTRTVTCSGDITSALQTAVSASATGDTVQITAGNCSVSATAQSSVALTLLGAGQGVTNITLTGTNAGLIGFSYKISGGVERVSGFTVQGNIGRSIAEIEGNITFFRIDHITVNDPTVSGGTRAFTIGYQNMGTLPCPHMKGLVDHLNYTSSRDTQAITAMGCNENWGSPPNLGTDDAYFIEDNTFNFTGSANCNGGSALAVDGEHGPKFVYRHNTINNCTITWHDTGSTPEARSTRSVEIYDNVITTSTGGYTAIGWRGGTGVAYDNSIAVAANAADQTGYQSAVNVEIKRLTGETYGTPWEFACGADTHRVCWMSPGNIRKFCSTDPNQICYSVGAGCWGGGGTCQESCTTDADCGGAPNKCLLHFDGPGTGALLGYPCRDQPGVGMDGSADSNGPSMAQLAGGDPVYIWNNTNPNKGGALNTSPMAINSIYAGYVSNNKDYYEQSVGDQTGVGTPFTGATGVGRGTLARRPSSCTPGVAYWETDNRRLDKCTATNVWTDGVYKPYPYPHPQQGGGSAPTAPNSLQAMVQ